MFIPLSIIVCYANQDVEFRLSNDCGPLICDTDNSAVRMPQTCRRAVFFFFFELIGGYLCLANTRLALGRLTSDAASCRNGSSLVTEAGL